MGSIKDFGHFSPRATASGWEDKSKGRFGRRLLRQTAAAALLLLLVAAGVDGDSGWGQSARYVVQTVSGEGSDWLEQAPSAPVLAPEEAAGTGGANGADINAEGQPVFTAPASGVVVTDVTATSDGFSSQQGILIQGNAGQNVKAAADGQVCYLGTTEDGYLVEVSHSQGFTSVYQGLSQLSVSAGADVTLGQPLGSTDSGELTFSLLLDGVEVNPLEYLFE